MNLVNDNLMRHFKEFYPFIYHENEIDEKAANDYINGMILAIEKLKDIEAQAFCFHEPSNDVAWEYLRQIQKINTQITENLQKATKEKNK
jgi:hypothetical protein